MNEFQLILYWQENGAHNESNINIFIHMKHVYFFFIV